MSTCSPFCMIKARQPQYTQTSIQRTCLANPFCSLYRLIHYIKYIMALSKFSKWELVFFTISRNSLFRGSLYQDLSVLVSMRRRELEGGRWWPFSKRVSIYRHTSSSSSRVSPSIHAENPFSSLAFLYYILLSWDLRPVNRCA